MKYTGIPCAACNKPFEDGDDIVVCPECGAPYHRACYQEKGACIFDDLHKEGKEWKPPAPPQAPDPRAEIKDQECPVCGTLNGHSALFCNRCGASLTGEPRQYNNTAVNQGGAQGPYGGATQQGSGYGAYPPPRTGFGGTVPAAMAARTMENENDRRMTIMLLPFVSCSAKLPGYGLIASAFFD